MTGAASEPEAPSTPLPDALKGFTDLDAGAWYIGAVEECVGEGFISEQVYGTGSRRARGVAGGQAVCRGERVARGLERVVEPFGDVDPQPYYYTALCWAVHGGVVSKASEFRPDDECTRAEFDDAPQLEGPASPVRYPSGYPDWHEVPGCGAGLDGVAVERGVVGGAGRLMPNKACTRAEAAAMVAALLATPGG